jgi:hypothetical protein
VPLAALTVPTNWNLYLVLTARALDGLKIAMLPMQMMLLAAILPDPTGLSRNVCLLIDPQLIGRLKFAVIAVSTSTSTAPSVGFVDITTGRGFIDAVAAGNPPAHRMITNAAIATLLTMDLSTVATPLTYRP